MDHPDLKALFVENEEPTSAFGTKALGEPPACSVAPAIRNAVFHATGVAVKEAPMNPHNLFRAFSEAGLFDKEPGAGSKEDDDAAASSGKNQEVQ